MSTFSLLGKKWNKKLIIFKYFLSFVEGESIFDSMADLPPDDTTNRLNTEETEMLFSESVPAKLGSPLESADGGDLISHSEIDQELQVVIMDPSVEFVGKLIKINQFIIIKEALRQLIYT